jgi:putative ABC transport system permease protein
MLRLLGLLTFRTLRAHGIRTSLSVFGIVLGVATILAIGITNLAAMDSVTRLFQNTSGRASLMVVNSEQADKSIPESLVRRISGQSGVAYAVPLVTVQTAPAEDTPSSSLNLTLFGANVQGLALYGIDPAVDVNVREYQLSEGRFLSSYRQASEIVLVRDYALEKKFVVGNRIPILTPNGVEELKLVGLIEKVGAGQTNNGAFGVIPLRLAQNLFDRNNKLDRIDIVAAPGFDKVETLDILRESLQTDLGNAYSVIYPSSQGKRMTQMLNSYQIGLNFMSGMALFVGAFLIYNAFSMSVIERTREFGMLRTIGTTRTQVIILVLAEALLLGLIGSGLGVGLGLLMAFGLARLMEMMLGQTLAISQVPVDALITSISVGVLTTFMASLLPALQAGRISPLEALRVRGKVKPGWLLRFGWIPGLLLLGLAAALLIWNPFPYDVQFRLGSLTVFALFAGAGLLIPGTIEIWEWLARPAFVAIYGSSGRLGSGNLRREKLRTTLTVGALMVGVSMTLVTQGLTASFKGDLLDWINAYVGGDLYLSTNQNLPDNFPRRLENIQGVQVAVPMRYFEVKLRKPDGNDESITYMAVDPAAYTRVTQFVFSSSQTDPKSAVSRLEQGNAVFISSVLAERYGYQEGGSIQLKTASGMKSFNIAAVVVDFYNQGLVITGSWKDMLHYFRFSNASVILLKLDPSQSVNEVQSRIDKAYGKKYNLTIVSNQLIKGSINQLMGQAFSLFDVLAQIAIVVASLGVVNTITMNVLERIREIGMLRSIGMTRYQVARMILAEAGMMGLVGAAFGLVFGLVLSRIFLSAMMAMSGYQLTYSMPIKGVLLNLAVALVICQLAAILPAIRAARVRVLRAIQYE